jgi:branched-chain amino acid transport system substrate-binding protein
MGVNEESINIKFNLALNLFDNKEYQKAIKNFEEIVYNLPFNSKTTISHFFICKAYNELGNVLQAEKKMTDFVDEYPNSKYADEVRILLCRVYFTQTNYLKCLDQICRLIETTSSPSYNNSAKEFGNSLIENHFTAAQLFNEIKNYGGSKSRAYLKLNLAKLYLKEKNNFQAELTLNELLKSHVGSEEFSEAAELLKEMPELKRKNYDIGTYIGVICPVVDDTVADKQVNPPLEVLEGIKFAVDEYNFKTEKKVALLIRDSNRDKKRISEIHSEFAERKDIPVVLGPVFSDEVRYALDIFKGTDIPIISPTATDNDLTDLNPNFFQANPNFSVRGKVMAQYIYFVENKRKIAVLSASAGYSATEAMAFIKEFQAIGGTIVIHETYNSSSFQLDEPVKNIARQVKKIEGLYLPLSDKIDAPVILSQLYQHKIDVNLYGNQDWFMAKGFETSTNLSNKLTFISDYYIDYENPGYKEFAAKFKEKTGLNAERNALYGYDLAKFVLDIIDDKIFDKDTIAAKIKSGSVSEGFHNNISFNKYRINRYLNIVRFKDGIFELIDRFQSSNN